MVPCLIDESVNVYVSQSIFITALFALVGIKYPVEWTDAVITFLISFDGETWEDLLDDAGTEISKTVIAGQFRELDSSEFKTAVYLKIRSGTAAIPVAQEADRIFMLYERRYLK
jgi:hypothetical protein